MRNFRLPHEIVCVILSDNSNTPRTHGPVSNPPSSLHRHPRRPKSILLHPPPLLSFPLAIGGNPSLPFNRQSAVGQNQTFMNNNSVLYSTDWVAWKKSKKTKRDRTKSSNLSATWAFLNKLMPIRDLSHYTQNHADCQATRNSAMKPETVPLFEVMGRYRLLLSSWTIRRFIWVSSNLISGKPLISCAAR